MSKYLLEIKNRIIFLFITWFSVFITGYFYKEVLLFLFIESEVFIINEFKVDYFIFTDVVEVFSVYLQLIFFLSLQVFVFYILYQSLVFITYGLFVTEYYYLNWVVKTSISVWFLSLFIAKYILIPATWEFFFNFQDSKFLNLHFEAKLNEYLNFYINFYYVFIFYCQILTFLFLFFSYMNTNILLIKKFRKLYYYLLVLFSTLVSPPDIFSQFFISLIVIFFYELFIFSFILKLSLNLLIRKPVKANKNTCSK